MRKRIEYISKDEENGSKNRLWIEIAGIRTNEDMKEFITEVLGLGFEVWRIEEGEIKASKNVDGPLDIVDPKYKSYRALARLCDE